MRAVAAYVLTFFLAPTFSALAGLIGELMPFNFVTALLTQALVGFTAVWIGRLIFSWLGVAAGWPMAVMLLVGMLWNDFSRPVRGDKGGTPIGSVVGILGGAIWLL
jgi:hypothetical protein